LTINKLKFITKLINKIKISILWGGKRPESPCQYLHWAKGPFQGRTPPRPWEEPSSAMNVAEDKGSSLLLVVTLRVIPWNRISTKTEKDNGKNGNI